MIAQLNPTNSAPTWPTNYPTSDDYAVINQGQLKNIATQAYNELQARLPSSIWQTTQGQTLTAVVTDWNPSSGDAYAAVNLGQLKTIAEPFYDVLSQCGYPNSAYPWVADSDDYSVANIGQVKYVFDFDLSLVGPSNLSSTNGLAGAATLYWTLPSPNYATNLIIEEQNSGGAWTILQSLTNSAATSFAVTNLVEGQNYAFQVVGMGTNTFSAPASLADAYHSSFYGGILPTLTNASGSNQSGATNTFLTNPLVIQVVNSSHTPLVSAPITFSIAPGSDGGLSATSGGTTTPSVSVVTSSSGYVTNYYKSGLEGLANNVIVASAFAGTNNTSYNFVARSGVQSGLTAWYSADSGVITASGSVTNWSDLSANGYNLTNSIGTNAPTPGIDSITGRPVVQFNGSQSIFSGGGFSGLTNITILAVASAQNPNSSGALVDVGTASSSSPTKGLIYAGGNTSFVGNWSNRTSGIVPGGLTVKSGALAMSTVTYSNTNSLASFYSNGAAHGTATVANGATTSGISLGSLFSFAEWNGNIAEVIIYNRVLSTIERQEVENYLAGKYGIAPVITSPSTASGIVGVSFRGYTVTASNGPTSYGVLTGSLPAGLTLNTSTGAISGTPTTAGTSSVVISAKSSAGTGAALLNFTVYLAAAPLISSSTVASGVVGQPFQFAVAANNGATNYSITSGTLPSGLSLSATSGIISGTATTVTTGTPVTVKALNAYGNQTQSLTFIVGSGAPTISGIPLAAWFKADAGVSTINSSGSISQWNDQSSNTNNVSSSYPYAPTLTTDSASGKPVVNYAGNQLLTTPSYSGAGSTNDITVFTVAGTSAASNGQQTLVEVGDKDGAVNSARALMFDNGYQSFFYNDSSQSFFDGGPAFISPSLNINTMTFTSASPGTANFYSQGVANGSVSSITPAAIGSNLTVGNLSYYTPAYSWNGNIAEILLYSGALSTAQRQSVEIYLADKYGIYAPNADWITGYSTTVQGEINRNHWSKAQTDGYITLQANNPSMLTTGLKLWLKADSGVTLGVGPNVQRWKDQTGNYTLSQSESVDQPTLITNDFNGLPGIHFNPVSPVEGGQLLTDPSSAGAGVNSDMTILTVGASSMPGTSPQYSVFLGSGETNGASRALGYRNSRQYFDATGKTNAGTAAPPAQLLVADGASLDTNSPPNVTFYRNGTTIAGTPSGLSGTQTVNAGVSVGNQWRGDICEVLLYDHKLNPTTELPQVSTYLANKYGIYYPGASWVTNFTSPVQALITTNQWNESQANAYVQASQTLPVASGLSAWFKADSGIKTNGLGQVSTWEDSSGNHNDVSNLSTNSAVPAVDPLSGTPTVTFSTGQTLANSNTYSPVSNDTIIVMASTPTPAALSFAQLATIGQNDDISALIYQAQTVGGHSVGAVACYEGDADIFAPGQLPPSAWAASSPDATPPAPVLTPKKVHVNIKAPQVKSYAGVQLPATPTDNEITYSHAFREPLIPLGSKTSPSENQALSAAIKSYLHRKDDEDVSAITIFLGEYPNSAWRPLLDLNLAEILFRTGNFSQALDSWQDAWDRTQDLTDPAGQKIANLAVGKLAEMKARIGRTDELEALCQQIKGRNVSGVAAQLLVQARSGLSLMKNRPQDAFRCGPSALQELSLATRHKIEHPDSRGQPGQTIDEDARATHPAQYFRCKVRSALVPMLYR